MHPAGSASGASRAGSVLLAVAACCLAAFALSVVYGGLSGVGTIVWGYNDSGAIVYLVFGGAVALVGALAFYGAALLAILAASKIWPGSLCAGDARRRKLPTLALGATLGMCSVACLAFSLAAVLAIPSDTSDPSTVTNLVLGSSIVALSFGVCSGLVLRRTHRHRNSL